MAVELCHVPDIAEIKYRFSVFVGVTPKQCHSFGQHVPTVVHDGPG